MIDAGKRLERFFKEKIGLYVEAGLFLTVSISFAMGGKGSWEKEDGKLTAHLEEMFIKEGAAIALEAKLGVEYEKAHAKGELLLLSGKASSEATLSTSPRLEPGPQLWLDNKFDWNPLTIEITAKVNAPNLKAKTDNSGKIKPPTKGGVDAAVAAPASGAFKWKGEVFEPIKDRPLPSIDLFTGELAPRQWAANQKAIRVQPVPPPLPKPGVAKGPAPPPAVKL